MVKTAKEKRLDKIDVELRPKQWAIRLADEIRRHESLEDFLKSLAKSTWQQSPFMAPFSALDEQVKERWPPRPENLHPATRLAQELRGEFHALKLLIGKTNQTIMTKCEMWSVKNSLQLSKLQTITLRDAFAQTLLIVAAWIDIKKLLVTEDVAKPCHTSLLRNWADNSATLLTEIIAYKTAVQTIQERYFEIHPILFKDIGAALERTIQTVRDVIALFNADPLSRGPDQESEMNPTAPGEGQSNLSIDIEAVEQRAKVRADTIVNEWVTNDIKKLLVTEDVAKPCLTSLPRDWADNSATLLTEIIAYKTAVQTVQERYFENHPILFKDAEAALERTIENVRNVIALFNADPLSRGLEQESERNAVAPGEGKSNLTIDIEAVEQRAKLQAATVVDEWVTNARNESAIRILEETGEHEEFIWRNLRKEMGLES